MCFGPVDQNIADRRVLQQQLQRAQPERLVQHFVDQPVALVAVEQRAFGVAQMLDDQADLAAEHVAGQIADFRQVELSTSLPWIRRLRFSNSTALASSAVRSGAILIAISFRSPSVELS